MDTKVLEGNINIVRKQKNLFLSLTVLLITIVFFLSIRIATIDEKVILVPALRQEMVVSKNGISKSYLEEWALLFLSNLLDLNKADIEHKKALIMKYASNGDKKALEKLHAYFVDCIRDYKRFDLTTYFTVKNLEIDVENLSVISHGVLTSYFGKSGYESENEDYKLEFTNIGGNLRLKSFVRIMDADKIARDKAKSLKYEVNEEDFNNFDKDEGEPI